MDKLLRATKRPRLLRPFSLKSLLYAGFALALAPLFLAATQADFALRDTAALGEQAIRQVAEETKTTRELMRIVGEIERKARLYIIFSDPALSQPYERESYENAREQLGQALDGLLKSDHSDTMALLAAELGEKEKQVHEQIVGAATDLEAKMPLDEAFRSLHAAAAAIWQESEGRMDRKVEELHGQARSLREALLLRGGLLALASLAFVAGLLAALTRSIRQIDAAIQSLGAGDLARPIEVKGPKDLRRLGERLDWLRARLSSLEESKQRFMRNVSKELRVPFQGIEASAAALSALEPLVLGQQTQATQLAENVGRLGELLAEVLHYQRINESAGEHPKEAVNMKELVDSVAADYQPRLLAKSLKLKALLQPVALYGDAAQLRTLVEQLLSNAVHFSPEGGEIRVILRAAGEAMTLEVEDDGPGIDPAEAPHLFEPFFRGKAGLALNPEGSGLGLAIVDECVANHQGKLEVMEPRQDEKGARFRVELPLREAVR
jgi:two-component system sensor histidine kinase GlrK